MSEQEDLDLCVCGEDLVDAITEGYGNFPYTEGCFSVECYNCGLEVEVEASADVRFDVTFPTRRVS